MHRGATSKDSRITVSPNPNNSMHVHIAQARQVPWHLFLEDYHSHTRKIPEVEE